MIRPLFWSLSASLLLGTSSGAASDADAGADVLALVPISAYAQSQYEGSATPMPTGGATLASLFESVEKHTPLADLARADRAIEQSRILEARGAFDTNIDASYYGRLTGFWDGQNITSTVKKRLDNAGVEVYGGYRIGTGGFPIYEDGLATRSAGEVKVGARASLLRGRETDKYRTDYLNAQLGGQAAEADYGAVLIALKADAAQVYVNWLYWSRTVRVYEELLDIAQKRQQAIVTSIEAGQLSAITADENQQIIYSRQAQLLSARQRLRATDQQLGLYLRGEDGQPLRAEFGRRSLVPDFHPYDIRTVAEWQGLILDNRPDINALKIEMQRARNRVLLAQNDQEPTLDLGYEISRELGTTGSPTRAGTDNIVSLNFNLPFELSNARGRESRAGAELAKLQAQMRLIGDQVDLALNANEEILRATRAQIKISESDVQLTRRLAKAEETRYLAGASNFFQLNVQETQLANSELRLIAAERDHDQAIVQFYRLTGTFSTIEQGVVR